MIRKLQTRGIIFYPFIIPFSVEIKAQSKISKTEKKKFDGTIKLLKNLFLATKKNNHG